MAIRINVTVNPTNLAQTRQKIEKQLQGLNISFKGVEKATKTGGSEAKDLKSRTSQVSNLINHYKALNITREQFIKSGAILAGRLSGNNKLLASRARLMSAVAKAQKDAVKANVQTIQEQEKNQAKTAKATRLEIANRTKVQEQLKREQTARKELNRLISATNLGVKPKAITSMKTYNDVVRRSIQLLKTRRMTEEKYVQVTNQLMTQKNKLKNMDSNLHGQMLGNLERIVGKQNRAVEANARMNESFQRQRVRVQEANTGFKAYLQNLGMIIKKFADWILVANLIYAPFRILQAGVATIKEMDDALTNLNKVVEFSTSQLDSMRLSAIELGKEMGISATEIMRGMAEFGRIVKVKEDIEELTRVATIASNVTTLSADAAAKAITATMITFKKDISDASQIVDSFNEIQNNFRVSAEDLANSIGKVGAAARQAGISMEELEGYTTAIVSATGISGSVAGTALKSIISRTYRIGTEGEESAGKVEATLAGIGVSVRDVSKEFRDFDSIITDLSKKWDGLSNVTKQNIAQTIAGTYHYSRFLAMMENIDMARDATSKAINSENSALDENRKHLESITGRLGTLKATIEEVFAESISADVIKGLITTVTELIDAFASLRNVALVALTALGVWKGAAILAGLKKMGEYLLLLPWRLQTTATTMIAFNRSLGASAVATQLLTRAFGSLWVIISANPIGALMVAFTGLMLIMDKQKQKAEEAIRYQKQRNDELRREQELLARTTSFYEENYEKVEEDKQVKEELLSLQEQLNESFGAEAKALDLLNGKYDENSKKLKELRAEKLRAAISEMKLEQKQLKTEFATPAFVRGFGDFKITDTAVAFRQATQYMGEASTMSLEEYRKKLIEIRDEIDNAGDEHVSVAGMILKSDKAKYKAVVAINDKLEELNEIQQKQQEYTQATQELAEIDQTAETKFNKTSLKAYEILKKRIDGTANYEEKLQNIKNLTTGSWLKNHQETMEELNGSLLDGSIGLDEYSKKAGKVRDDLMKWGITFEETGELFDFQSGLVNVESSVEEVSDAFESTNAKFDSTKEKLTLLKTAFDELRENEKLSIDTNAELVKLYPELNNTIGDTEETLSKLDKIYETEAGNAKNFYIQSLEASTDFYNKLKENGTTLFDGLDEEYQKDLKSFKTLQQTKVSLQNKIFLLETAKSFEEYKNLLEEAGEEVPVRASFEFALKDESLQKYKKTLKDVEKNTQDFAKNLDFEEMLKTQELENRLEELIGNLNLLGGAINDVTDGNKLNAETISELLVKYPSLISVQKDEKKLLEELKRLHSEDAKSYKEAIIEKLAKDDEYINEIAENNEDFFNDLSKAYDTDLKNWGSYLKFKEEMARQANLVIGKEWAEDFDESLKILEEKKDAIPAWALDSGYARQLDSQKDFIEGEKEVRNLLDERLEGVDFDKIGIGDKSKAKDLTKVTAEKYIELYLALDSVNNALEENSRLQDLTKSDEEKIKLLDKESNLIDKKRASINNLIKSLEQEKDQKVKQLRVTYGVSFDKTGKLETSNISEILKREADKVNKLAQIDDEAGHKKALESYNKLEEIVGRVKELEGTDLPSLFGDLSKLNVDLKNIDDNLEGIELEQFEKKAEALEGRLKQVDKELKDLNNELSLVDSDDYGKKLEITNRIITKTGEKQKIVNGIIQDLKNSNYKYADSVDAVKDLLEEYGVDLSDITQEIKEQEKAYHDLTEAQKEAHKKEVDEAVTGFIEYRNKLIEDEIENLKELSDVESMFADKRIKNYAKIIEANEREIKRLKEKDELLDSIREKEDFDKDIKKQKEKVENLKKEKTQRIYREGVGFVWETDKLAIKEEEEELNDMLADYDDWKREDEIKKKEKENEAYEDEIEKIQDDYGNKISLLESLLIDSSKIIDENTEVPKSWEELLNKLSNYNEEFYTDYLIDLKSFFGEVQNTIDSTNINADKLLNPFKDLMPDTIRYKPNAPFEELQRTDSQVDKTGKIDFTPTEKERVIETMKANSAKWFEAKTNMERDALAQMNDAYGKKLGWTKKDGVWYTEEGVKAYKNGGIVDYTGLALVHGSKSNPERVLSSEQNKAFTSLLNSVPNVMNQDSKTEVYNINIDKVQTNDALGFVNNLKKLTYTKGRGA